MDTKKLKVIVADTAAIFLKNDINVYAGYATLRILEAMIPLLVLVIAVLNLLPGYKPEMIADFVIRLVPNIPEIQELFLSTISRLQAQSSGLLASVAAVTTLFSASRGINALQKGLQKVAIDSRKTLGGKIKALLFTVFLVLFVPLSMIVVLIRDNMAQRIGTLLGGIGLVINEDSILRIFRQGRIAVMIGCLFLIIMTYTYLPDGKRPIRSQIPGAVLCAAGWFLFTEGFSLIMPVFWKWGLYGSLASLFLTINWLRVMITILLAGDCFNTAWQRVYPKPAETETASQTPENS